VRVAVLELQLLDEELEANGVLGMEPVASVLGDHLCVDVSDDRVHAVDLEAEVLPIEVLAVMADRVT
jgi:hypothetical protein